MNRTLTLAVLLLLNSIAVCQTPSHASDCSTLKYLRHKVSCLCGTVQVCSGDICGRPSDYDLDDDITVELRERVGTILDSKKVVVETREKQGTKQDGTKTSYKETERRFCFEGNVMATICLPSCSFGGEAIRGIRMEYSRSREPAVTLEVGPRAA